MEIQLKTMIASIKNIILVLGLFSCFLCSGQQIIPYNNQLTFTNSLFNLVSPFGEVIEINKLAYPDEDFTNLSQFGKPISAEHDKTFVMDTWTFNFESLKIHFVNVNGYKELSYIELSNGWSLVPRSGLGTNDSKNKLKPGTNIFELFKDKTLAKDCSKKNEEFYLIRVFNLNNDLSRSRNEKGEYYLSSAHRYKLEVNKEGVIKRINYFRSTI